MFVSLQELHEAAKRTPGSMDEVPSQLRHCVVAVKGERGKSATAAWRICRANLVKTGYMKSTAGGPPDKANMRMTQKGTRANMRHSMEKDVDKKNAKFAGAAAKIKF